MTAAMACLRDLLAASALACLSAAVIGCGGSSSKTHATKYRQSASTAGSHPAPKAYAEPASSKRLSKRRPSLSKRGGKAGSRRLVLADTAYLSPPEKRGLELVAKGPVAGAVNGTFFLKYNWATGRGAFTETVPDGSVKGIIGVLKFKYSTSGSFSFYGIGAIVHGFGSYSSASARRLRIHGRFPASAPPGPPTIAASQRGVLLVTVGGTLRY
jgi:hypothetical protein